MKRIAVVLLVVPCLAYADTLYTCKGKNGEVVVTVNQADCKDTQKTSTLGNYDRQPDDARNQRQASAYAESEHERLTAPISNVQTFQDRYAAPEAPRAAGGGYKNSLSEAYRHQSEYHPSQSHDVAIDQSPPPGITGAQPAPGISDCRSGPSGSVTCYDTAGNASFGNTHNGAVFDSNGNAQYLQRNGNGQLQTDNGTCVKDIYGKCQ